MEVLSNNDSGASAIRKINSNFGSLGSLASPLVKLRVGTYNIGHFNLGVSASSRVTNETLDTWVGNYHGTLNNAALDILCMQEYEPNIVAGKPAKDWVFNNFKRNAIGVKNDANCNALFSNIAMGEAISADFVEHQQDRYFIYTTIKVGGKDVKLISTHLDFHGAEGTAIRHAQMAQLIDHFEDEDYVILCADFNINNDNLTDWDILRNAGYTLANMGYAGEIITCPYSAGTDNVINMKLDNICVKGFAISGVKTFGTLEMSDHYGLQADLTLIGNEAES